MNDFPPRHLSIRVPWHDSGWIGAVCKAPHLNGACAQLKRIAAAKNDDAEQKVAGKSFDELPRDQLPPCVDERGAFMAPFELDVLRRHALADTGSANYAHFKPTLQRLPAYSAGVVPFRWMMKAELQTLGERFELDVDLAREPNLGYESNWVHEVSNQTALLNGFAARLREEESLCLFYAKHVPFVEGTGRVLIGVGRVKNVGSLTEYERSSNGPRGMVWERPIQHSLDPKCQDGFLMPYIELLRRIGEEPALDVDPYVAHAPSEHWEEFSYASELVTHDGAIAALLSLDSALARMERELGIHTERQRQWLHDELVRLWKVRGPYPGLGAVLRAFGLERGLFVGHALQQRAGENCDPWPLVDASFQEPTKHLPKDLQRDLKELAATWNGLNAERRKVLRLLSRFDLTAEHAKHLYEQSSRTKQGWPLTDKELLQNPYRLYECSRHDTGGIHLMTIDRGVFPDDTVRLLHPLDAPSQCDSAADERRVRAFAIQALEQAAIDGHTLHFADSLVEAIRQQPVRPECPVTGDILAANVKGMAPEVVAIEEGSRLALQLARYCDISALTRREIIGRVNGQRHVMSHDWRNLLDNKLGSNVADPAENKARQEKAAALAELAESRFSILAGPAGAGKTTVLGVLCDVPEIKESVLLLAPTGKARVRMQQLAGSVDTAAKTIAQFLNQHGRYDGANGRYHVSDSPKVTGYSTVIVDEASMLTEDMLGALLDALKGVKRLILVGDPAQLPPIGAGRPFVDIIAKLRPDDFENRFPRVARGYAALTIERRQVGAERPDLQLAHWFSAAAPGAGDDHIFSVDDAACPSLRFVRWDKPDEFQAKLLEVLASELRLKGMDDQRGFNRSLGASQSGEYDYFNATRGDQLGAVGAVEKWQILSPLRGGVIGVCDMNRQIHVQYRAGFMDLASRQRYRQIPKPQGAERIVYGDKVINLGNHKRDRTWPKGGALNYLANGEIGVVVGQWRTKAMKGPPKIVKVEFSSQTGYTYDFYKNDFREENNAALELAYALTVHKAQGSQFELVILVLPDGHPILSRELLYTALTRHQQRVVVMHQGPRNLLKDFAAPERSATACRRTNLLAECCLVEVKQPKGSSLFLQEGLIHRTSDGRAVRSKSELLIAEALLQANVVFDFERPLTLGGSTRYPDFTIEDDIAGRVVYWEHLGMLDRDDYRASWERKLAWYRANSVRPVAEAEPGAPVLVTTEDSAQHGLDMGEVKRLIAEVCGG